MEVLLIQEQFVGEMTCLNCGLVYWNMVRAFEHNFLEWLTKHRLELTYTFVGNWEPSQAIVGLLEESQEQAE